VTFENNAQNADTIIRISSGIGKQFTMSLHVVVYEDNQFRAFYPLTYTRPVCALRAGIVPLYLRLKRFFGNVTLSCATREDIAPFLSETVRDVPVNIIKRGDGDLLFVNGRLRNPGDLTSLIDNCRLNTVFATPDGIAAVFFEGNMLKETPTITTPDFFVNSASNRWDDFVTVDTSATLYRGIWEIMADIEVEIERDYEWLAPSFEETKEVYVHDGAWLVHADKIFLGEMVEVMPGAVIDATKGPVYIGINSRIESHAAIYGPTAIGANSVVLAGKIATSSIGHTCRVGGEVEESIFHAYVNKYHAGFIGHSYVGQWVNFGAMTTNSDLKNNYSTIRLTMNGESFDSGTIKVGSFIGDHTKFGIGTLLNTGINIGPACNIFGGSLVTDKEVPPFQWGTFGQYERYQYDKAIFSLSAACDRRNCQLTTNEKELLRKISENAMSDKGIIQWP
jgi:UDP-N-acetylglucosamine diphosphorylase / glucose-1-phosphate thymidylyltransferase / UDP-N-acetylgalactosamine diphosphorylase / glucosamine-1-phosphate N-acetyltransferase / galactosamine-1-phosphate N-acetyltransferase